MTDLYFGFGSNLDHADWSRFCRARGYDPESLKPVGPATLPGETLVFDYRSTRRQCGALNIRATPGASVDGYLFVIDGDGWAALDVKEGHPHLYRREIVTVRDAAGRAIAAQTYRVVPEQRIGFCAPNAAYLAVCRAGRARYGVSTAQLEAAARGER